MENNLVMEHFYQNIGEDWFSYPGFYSLLARELPSGSRIVEIGSWRGRSACYLGVEIHNSGKDIKLDCVDTWKGSIEHQEYDILLNDGLYNEFMENMKPLSHIITPIRKPSLEAVEMYADESLETVFIDGSHTYEDVIADMKAWYPKVKTGFFFSGHDYGGIPDVTNAVHEFFESNNLKFFVEEGCWHHIKGRM